MFNFFLKLKNQRSKITWLLAELLTIFIGVYAAFLLDNYKTARKNELRKVQFLTAMREEFMHYSQINRENVPIIDSVFTDFVYHYEKGNMPLPKPIHIAAGTRTNIWETTLQTGAMEILDIHFIFEMTNYFSNRSILMDEWISLRRLSELYIIPNAQKDITEFYNTESGEFKEEYYWYYESIVRIQNLTHRLYGMTDSLLLEMNSQLEQLN